MKGDIIFGKYPVLEALEGNRRLEKILVVKGSAIYKEVMPLARAQNIVIQFVPEEKLNRITRKNHQGIIAYVGYVDYQDLDNILAQVYEDGETPLFVALDGVTDVGNMGAIVRSAYAMGAHAIIVPEKGSALINGVAVKASAGAVEKMNFCKVKSLKKKLSDMQLNGLQLLATTLSDKAIAPQMADFTLPTCIIMGSEETGVGKNICEMSNEEVFIPMAREFDSLNVSVAAGILLYEAHQQRLKSNF